MPETSIRAFSDTAVEPHVRGFLHLPNPPNGDAIVLTHGAGSNAQAPLLVALAEAFCAAGFTILRCDLPYRQTRSFGPPGPADAARDRAGLKNAIAALRKIITEIGGAPGLAVFARPGNPPSEVASGGPPNAVFVGWESTRHGDFDRNQSEAGKIFLAGHSYGGRQCTILCSELAQPDPGLVAGLLLLSYPLHPPRKPEQQRTRHFPNLRTPALFVHGTRDPFGSIAEIEHALKMIPARTKLLPVEGAGHDLGFKGKATQEGLPVTISSTFQEFFAGRTNSG